MNGESTTIAAVATPVGRGGIGVVRVSGPAAAIVAKAVTGSVPVPRLASVRAFRDADGSPIDHGLVVWMPAPRSYTGEDVLELQGHGGPVVLDMLLERVLGLGVRLARPGEFSERAFLNDRMDLAQAEAVADLIEAQTTAAARGAMRSLCGELSNAVRTISDRTTDLRAYVEAAMDFPDEELDLLADAAIVERLRDLAERISGMLRAAEQGALLREGATVTISGRPNVGKSSLLNRLAGRDAAIVTEIPGTTRDPVREHVHVAGIPLHLVDTAGLRDSDDPVERIGIQRAHDAIAQCQVLLLVTDDDEAIDFGGIAATTPRVVVRNKIDLEGREPRTVVAGGVHVVHLSAKSGAGVDALRDVLGELLLREAPEEGQFVARRRHVTLLRAAADALRRGRDQLGSGGAVELLAEELRETNRVLGEITGEVTTEDLLARIFSTFCIGK